MPATRHLIAAWIAAALCLAGMAATGAPPAHGESPAPRRLTEPDLSGPLPSYVSPLPPHAADLAALDDTPAHNPVTDAGARLGRVLFHDRSLSQNGLVSCGSCHSQRHAFDDPTRLSLGFSGRITRRSAMALGHARFNPRGRYFRDERAESLEAQVLHPFTDGVEMGLGPGDLAARVAASPVYPPLFEAAFGKPVVDDERIGRALAQFVRAMASFGSRYDAGRAAGLAPLDPFPGFTAPENRGKALFFTPREAGGAGCSTCHQSEAFVLLEPANNGLDADNARDGGVGEASGERAALGLFRTASLRNVAVSAPYMHDGRFRTLEEVIAHYAGGVADNPALSAPLRAPDGRPARLDHLDAGDRAALVAFLGTLTDPGFLADPRFTDPFLAPRPTGATR